MKEIEELYILYKQDVYQYLLSLTHNPTLSEDILSDTFVSAITSINSFKGHSSVKTWLFSIARNTWLQRLRKEKPAVEFNDLVGLYVTENLSESFITKQTINRIKQLLQEKDERTQQIAHLRIEGYSFLEIAHKVGVSENSARVINYRTRNWIKFVIEEEEKA